MLYNVNPLTSIGFILMTQDAALIIKVNVTHEHGLFYAESPDLLGLHICGETPEQLCATVVKAVKALFKYNRQMDVDVIPATSKGSDFPGALLDCDHLVVQLAA